MDFVIADSFLTSLARLTGDEQKAVKTTAFDLQLNPATPGMSFHKLDKAKDKNFWSVRVGSDLRLIVHKVPDSLLLSYVDHHDKAYEWAERRRLQTHPTTGAAQFVEVRETVQEIRVPRYVDVEEPKPEAKPLFADVPDEALLSYGVPAESLPDVHLVTSEDSLLDLYNRLPSEAGEALFEIATGGKPRVSEVAAPAASPFTHPDAQRHFRIMTNVAELERAFAFPWDRWTIFLHPDQRELVERSYVGPARVSGTAGTGKTVVALHRAVFLTRAHPDARVLLTTFSEVLANALKNQVRRLIAGEPMLAERLDVEAIDAVGERLYKALLGEPHIASHQLVGDVIRAAAAGVPGHKLGMQFLVTEWEQVVDAWQLGTWEAYRDVARLGRKTRIAEKQRRLLWSIFQKVRADLAARGLITGSEMFSKLAAAVVATKAPPYDFLVVDEAQDLGVAQLRFLAAMGKHQPDGLFFTGDLGQRIFQQPFSWLTLGVDVRGRSKSLRVNYRTSHQIRMQADRLLEPQVSDVDGNVEDRRGTISVFNGPAPDIKTFETAEREVATVGEWLAARTKDGVLPHEFGIFVRSAAQLERAQAAAKAGKLQFKILDERVATATGYASIATMPLAKGLEFRAVAVMACDDEVIPSQERIDAIGDDADLQEVYDTERHLLYVACTRARDHLLVTGVEPASEFLDDMAIGAGGGHTRG